MFGNGLRCMRQHADGLTATKRFGVITGGSRTRRWQLPAASTRPDLRGGGSPVFDCGSAYGSDRFCGGVLKTSQPTGTTHASASVHAERRVAPGACTPASLRRWPNIPAETFASGRASHRSLKALHRTLTAAGGDHLDGAPLLVSRTARVPALSEGCSSAPEADPWLRRRRSAAAQSTTVCRRGGLRRGAPSPADGQAPYRCSGLPPERPWPSRTS